jgi:hypothetical protein
MSVVLRLALFAGAAVGGCSGACKEFQAGLCPGPADCMCTTGAACAAPDAPKTDFLKEHQIGVRGGSKEPAAFLGCAGECRKVGHNECPGSASCLNDLGPCDSPGPGTWNLEAAVAFAESCCAEGGCQECPCNTPADDLHAGGKLGNRSLVNFRGSSPSSNLPQDVHPDECACECAEFVSKIIAHGGEDDGNIINCVPLYDWLSGGHGWSRIGSSPSDVRRGDVIIYAAEGPKTHTCFGVGDGIVDCHNNNHCHASADMGYTVDGVFRHD